MYDDYGHHPTEIMATAHAVNQKEHRQSWVVFQPHTYSRTKTLLDDFAKALLDFDNIYGVSSQDLVDKLQNTYNKKALYISDFNEIAKYLKEHTIKNDIVLTLGAGTVTNIGPLLVK